MHTHKVIYTPEQTKRNLESFIRFLKKQHKVKPESFDITELIHVNIAASRAKLTEENVHNCGTVACIRGWAQIKLQWDTKDYQDAYACKQNSSCYDQAISFGLSVLEYDWLCYGRFLDSHLWKEIDIPIAIKCLRALAKHYPYDPVGVSETPDRVKFRTLIEGIISNELLKRSQKSLNLGTNPSQAKP